MGWPSKHDRVLTRWFFDGLSFAQMSAKTLADLGVHYSRNACIGRAHRLNLEQADRPKAKRDRPATSKPWEANGTSKRTYYRHKQAATIQPKPKPEPRHFACDAVTGLRVADVVPLHLHLLELKPDQCRYPYGRSRYTFCGNPIFGETSYCEPHLSLCMRAVA
jgi:GcrA cell cycle regulator